MTSPDMVRLRVMHAVRVLGYANTGRVSERAGMSAREAEEVLLEAQAADQVNWSQWQDQSGWSLTEAGKVEGERLLAEEVDAAGARNVVESAMAEFEPLNELVAAACTRWQLTEINLAHPPADLAEVISDLTRGAEGWAKLEKQLVHHLPRFTGYHDRFNAAVERARTDPTWVIATDRDSAHKIWFELHEDLLATIGGPR